MYLASSAALSLLAGDSFVKRPVAEVAAICQQLPTLWVLACAHANRTHSPRAILDHYDSAEEVTVPLDVYSSTLPNIDRQLLLLAQLHPGRHLVG